MKNILLILSIIILSSCVSQKASVLEPLWYSDSFPSLSEDKYIVFKSNASTEELAELQIYNQSKYLKDYIEPEKKNEFSHPESGYYFLYAVKKSDLEDKLNSRIEILNDEYLDIILEGDSTRDLLDKYSFYSSTASILSEFDDIYNLGIKESLNINDVAKDYITDVNEMLNYVKSQLAFNVVVDGDIDGLIKNSIIKELHELGFITSDEGYITIKADVTINEVVLDNDYINKYWSISLHLLNLVNNSNKSLSFQGRESHIDEMSLQQLIIDVMDKKIDENLVTILPKL